MTDDSIEAFIVRPLPPLRPVVRRLRERIRAAFPDLLEYVDGYGLVRYGTIPSMWGWVGCISSHKEHANLGFAHGSSLPEPDGLVEGTGKNLRNVPIRTTEDANHPGLIPLLEAAIRLG